MGWGRFYLSCKYAFIVTWKAIILFLAYTNVCWKDRLDVHGQSTLIASKKSVDVWYFINAAIQPFTIWLALLQLATMRLTKKRTSELCRLNERMARNELYHHRTGWNSLTSRRRWFMLQNFHKYNCIWLIRLQQQQAVDRIKMSIEWTMNLS